MNLKKLELNKRKIWILNDNLHIWDYIYWKGKYQYYNICFINKELLLLKPNFIELISKLTEILIHKFHTLKQLLEEFNNAK
jgi:hypothetical protein